MRAYYNEIEPYPAQWLRNLIAAGHLPAGDVDERSIVEVRADDLRGYERCHFFAGISGWGYALSALVGWPEDRPVWTGSCPCQPFSAAGKQKGAEDERHLWPEFRRLIADCHPPTIFGEQVASRLGREWLAGVRADLEALGYAVGAADLCAPSVGAPHIRQRLWWVADALSAGRSERRPQSGHGPSAGGGAVGGLADASGERCNGKSIRLREGRPQQTSLEIAGGGAVGRLADADDAGLEGWRGVVRERAPERSAWAGGLPYDCTDGRSRRIEPGIFPLAHGAPGRVGRLRAYGNTIVPQEAAKFIEAFLTCRP